MSLISLGKRAVQNEELVAAGKVVQDIPDQADDAVKTSAAQSAEAVAKVRKDVQAALTPWIPGDFIGIYGGLLVAWEPLRGEFWPLATLAVLLSVAFVYLGAMTQGKYSELQVATKKRLGWRAGVGAVVSVVVAATIPQSGWSQFGWFTKYEAPTLLTIALLVPLFVLCLNILAKRELIDQPA